MNKNFKTLAEEAIECTKKGLDTLIEIHEIQEALKNFPKTKDYQQLVQEIIGKEKVAVGLIQRATLIQRGLMKTQHEEIEKIINNL